MNHLMYEESYRLITWGNNRTVIEKLVTLEDDGRQLLNPVSLGVSDEVGDVCAPRSAWRG